MTIQADLPSGSEAHSGARHHNREEALRSALRKRAARVPSLTIPEAAALCSVSREHLYRLVRSGAFPAVRMKGRYVIPAAVVEQLFESASSNSEALDVSEWAAGWNAPGGAQ